MFFMMIALALVVVLGVGYRWAGKALVWYDEVAAVQLAWLTYYGSAYAKSLIELSKLYIESAKISI